MNIYMYSTVSITGLIQIFSACRVSFYCFFCFGFMFITVFPYFEIFNIKKKKEKKNVFREILCFLFSSQIPCIFFFCFPYHRKLGTLLFARQVWLLAQTTWAQCKGRSFNSTLKYTHNNTTSMARLYGMHSHNPYHLRIITNWWSSSSFTLIDFETQGPFNPLKTIWFCYNTHFP